MNERNGVLDWLIVGGGPHGIHMAIRLLDEGVHPDRIAILDPNTEPLTRWKHHTEDTGMAHLRSPEVHNLGIDALSLTRHANSDAFLAVKSEQEKTGSTVVDEFIPPYSRPSLRLFMHHVQSLVEDACLMERWRSDRAISIHDTKSGYRVETDAGEPIEAENVVLALGIGDQPNWPSWATHLKSQDSRARLQHIFSPEFRRDEIAENQDVAIVGAGITAAQLALSLLEVNPNRQITIVSRHSLQAEDFDSDPGWLGPTLLKYFDRETDYAKRRSMIVEARNRGSLASEVMRRLLDAIFKKKTINLELAEIDSASFDLAGRKMNLQIRSFELDETHYQNTGEIEFKFCDRAHFLEADTVVLATGFEAKRPGGTFVDDAIHNLNLPTAEDGFPIVDRYLRWRKGLFVMGPLAELEVGPASRNISGARMAVERIVESPEAEKSATPSASSKRHRINATEQLNLTDVEFAERKSAIEKASLVHSGMAEE